LQLLNISKEKADADSLLCLHTVVTEYLNREGVGRELADLIFPFLFPGSQPALLIFIIFNVLVTSSVNPASNED
jgi:hypothetical protein